MHLQRGLAVQIIQASNVGAPKKTSGEEEGEEDEKSSQGGEEEKKFESTYLDPGLIKEKKKASKDA